MRNSIASCWRVAAASAMLILAGCEPGLLVRVENAGPVERSDLVVTVTGERYALPPIPPGGTTEVAVEPRGESAVAVESGGRTLGACCYIEPAYRGYAHFRIDGDSAAVVSTRIRIAPYGL